MNPKHLFVTLSFCGITFSALAQGGKLSINNIYKIYLQNSGSIMEKGQVKGYFFFYQTDKIDKHTDEYALKILDQNLNMVKEIKFDDDRGVELLEAAYNGNTLVFLFHNKKEKMLESRMYDLNGQMKFTYTKELDKKSEVFIESYEKTHTEDYTNQQLFSLNGNGFAMVVPLRDGKQYTYEADYYSSATRNEWDFNPGEDDRISQAAYLGNTDSLIILEVTKKEHLLTGKPTSSLLGLNFVTRRTVFELDDSKDTYQFLPEYCTKLANSGNLILMGSYYDKSANLQKDFSLGLAIYIITPGGEIVSKTYNSWAKDISKFLPMNEKGKIDDIGFLFFHNMIQAADGNFFAIGEGYKRTADAVGIGLNVLNAVAGGGMAAGGNTKIKITDMVVLKFSPDYKIAGATIQQKNPNNFHTMYADLNSQHTIALLIKALGGFDYAFTVADKDVSTFSVCYDDYERNKDYKGETFHALRYNGTTFTDDKLELASSASRLRVFPAKPGFVMIMEYFKKDKRLDMRLEKMN